MDRAETHLLAASLQYTQMPTFRRRECCDFVEVTLHQHCKEMIFPVLAMKSQIQSLTSFGAVLVIFGAWARPALGDQQQQPVSFQVQKSDLAKAEKLADELVSLSPRVNRDEAKLVAGCAFATVSKLRREYRMFGTPIFNNFLIYHGLRKRGYCYQWSEDLLIALDALRLKSLELHWGEYDPGTWRENNCIVVTAKGQPFKRDYEHYVENSAYARHVLDRSEAPNASGAHHRVAFQKRVVASGKPGD